MLSNSIIIFLFGILFANINGFEHCPGPSNDSQEDLTEKFNASSIVIYGKVTEVNGNTVTLKISCPLKGQLIESTIQLNQVSEVTDINECHYLTTNKDYIVFIEPVKLVAPNNNLQYRLANLEEIEVTETSLTKFIDDECNDEDDYGIPMTIFYTDTNNKCGKFQAICNEKTKTSILNFNYPPLSKTSIFIGGLKYALPIPSMAQNGDEIISAKQSVGTDDVKLRNMASISAMFMPIIVILTSLTIMFNN